MLIPLSLCLLIPMLDLLAYPDADDSNDDPDQKKFNAEHVLVR